MKEEFTPEELRKYFEDNCETLDDLILRLIEKQVISVNTAKKLYLH